MHKIAVQIWLWEQILPHVLAGRGQVSVWQYLPAVVQAEQSVQINAKFRAKGEKQLMISPLMPTFHMFDLVSGYAKTAR